MVQKSAQVAVFAIVIGCSGSVANAQNMYGTDAMFSVMNDVITACGLTSSDAVYRGTSSAIGERAMGPGDPTYAPAIPAGNQQIAPMSRFLGDVACDFHGPNRGQGMVVGLDTVSIVADDSAPTNTCNTLRFSGAVSGYTFDDWRDVLRVVYTGQTVKLAASFDSCNPNDPARAPSAPGTISVRCDGAIRASLVANWSEMFEAGCANGDCPNGLRHAFRRNDFSVTTDTFLTLLGLPASTSRTFCNGFDTEDLDPIRRACDPNEQVCSAIAFGNRRAHPDGGTPVGTAIDNAPNQVSDLGLVLPIYLPSYSTQQYGPPCALGKFQYAYMPFAASQESQRCPDGTSRQFGSCRFPRSATNQFNCLAAQSTRPPIRTFTNMDGRAYNLVPRDPATGAPLFYPTGIVDQRWGGGGWYRIHQTAAMANGVGTCKESDESRQIGCLVNADPCSIGYAGRFAATWSGAATFIKSLNLRTPQLPGIPVGPSDANYLLVLDPAGNANGACNVGPGDNFGNRYPLTRRQWINASKGFAYVTDDATPGGLHNELKLLTCIQDRAGGVFDAAMSAAKFVTLPPGAYPIQNCQ